MTSPKAACTKEETCWTCIEREHQHIRGCQVRVLGLCALPAKQLVQAGTSGSILDLIMKLFHKTTSEHCMKHLFATFSLHSRTSDTFFSWAELMTFATAWKLQPMVLFHSMYLSKTKQELVCICTPWIQDCLITLFCNTSLATKLTL